MKNIISIGLALFLLFFSMISSAISSKPYPLENFALREVVNRVSISPDGKHLALIKILGLEADPVIEVYETDNMAKEPYRVNAKPMEIVNFYWASNDSLIMRLRQQVRDKIDGYNEGVYDFLLGSVDIKQKKLKQYDQLGAEIVNLLPNKPNKVLISYILGWDRSGAAKKGTARQTRSYYELDLKTGSRKLILQGKLAFNGVEFDSDGRAWTAFGFDKTSKEYVWYVRLGDSKEWKEIHRLHEDSDEGFNVEGFDEQKPHILLVTAQNGDDKIGLWEFDAKTKKFGELIYRRNDVDVAGVRFHSNDWSHSDTIVGVVYYTDNVHVEYFDDVEDATHKQLLEITPNAYNLRIANRSRDGASMIIYNTAPRDPGSYYLLHKGKFSKVGSKQPALKAENLADVKYIHYQSRDGNTIPAYVTIPNGTPPFPAVVLPHGGPFVSELVIYDEWAQMLANNGYLVLQPQYRGSLGHGIAHHVSAYKDGGQGGYKMQDDVDDGMLHLVKEGLVAPNRMAVYGWSYGGYVAMVAASRKDQIYQCTIAGAGVSDTILQLNYHLSLVRRFNARFKDASSLGFVKMWTDSLSPIKETEKVNVPIMLIHGSVDQRVPIKHSEIYHSALKKHGKNIQYVKLEGADHFSNTLFYPHQKLLYESLIGYLQKDCGPGGL